MKLKWSLIKNSLINTFFASVLALFLTGIPFFCHGRNIPIIEGFEELEDIDEMGFDSFSVTGIPKRSPAQDIINLLLAVDAIDILDEDFYLRTNPLNSRSLLDLPIFELHSCCLPSKCMPCSYPFNWIVSGQLFLNKTSRSNFTRNSTDLSSYIALTQPTLLEKLQTTIDHFKDLFTNQELDVTKIFALFQNLTVEERRAGLMVDLLHRCNDLEVRFWIPFYYLERNYILRPNEIKDIEREFGASDPEAQEAFQKQHLISDKIGFGDCRVEATTVIFERPMYLMRLGGYTTIPTAFAVHKGIFGSSFPRPATLPLLDLERLFNLAQNINATTEAEAFNTIRNYLLGALDRLSANLLDSPLGNNGHITIGGVFRTEALLNYFLPWQWTERVRMQSRLSLEYLFPAFESRFYVERNSFSEFTQRDFENNSMSEENLLFLEQELTKKLYLLALDTRIQPGPIFRWGSYACYRGNKWECSVGSDMWIQFRESRHRINTFAQTRSRIDTVASIPPFAYQSKLFGGIGYRLECETFEMAFSLNLDSTYANSGIGADYTASIKIETLF